MSTGRNLLVLLVGLPLLLVWLHVHWLFLLLDEMLFAGYRNTVVRRPIFILGVPRSGTTFLQRSLSEDAQFTTTTLQECLLTPAISQRYLARGLAAVLAPIAGVVKRLFRARQSRFGRKMSNIHPLGLSHAEEDFLLLLPVLGCFIQMVVFPSHAKTWRLGFFDEQLSRWQRQAIMEFYFRLVQRHVYFHGDDKTYLAKNPSFTSLIASLHQYFDDAVIIACVRDPKEAITSQIRSLAPAFELLGHDINAPQFSQKITALLAHYYREIERYAQNRKVQVLEITELKQQLFACLQQIYRHAGMAMSQEQTLKYQQLAEQNKQFRSKFAEADQRSAAAMPHQLQHLWPLSGSGRLLSSTENVS